MSTFTTLYPPPPLISIVSPESVGVAYRNLLAGTFASAAWPTANKAIFVPFYIRQAITVTQLWTANGSSAANTRDIGIYDASGTLIIAAGSTAGGSTNTLQTYDIADTTIGPGRFYLALASSNTTSQFFSHAGATRFLQGFGLFEQTTAFPLPATATFATITSAYAPLFGLATVTTV